eukprot:115950-Chlamydomonas_euryale.AAC.1
MLEAGQHLVNTRLVSTGAAGLLPSVIVALMCIRPPTEEKSILRGVSSIINPVRLPRTARRGGTVCGEASRVPQP